MKRTKKEIEIVLPEEAKVRFKGKKFRSFRAVAEELKPGEAVTVAVHESLGKVSIFSGYGRIKRTGEDTWVEPRQLLPEI